MQQPSPPRSTPTPFEAASVADQRNVDAFKARRQFWRDAMASLLDQTRAVLRSDLDGLEWFARRLLGRILILRLGLAQRTGDPATIASCSHELGLHYERCRELEGHPVAREAAEIAREHAE